MSLNELTNFQNEPVIFFEFLYLNLYLVLRNEKIFDILKQNEKLLYIINFILT